MKNRKKNTLNEGKFLSSQISERERWGLAKIMMVTLGMIFLCVAILMTFFNPNGIKEVWNFSTFLINSTVSALLGYYFGTKASFYYNVQMFKSNPDGEIRTTGNHCKYFRKATKEKKS